MASQMRTQVRRAEFLSNIPLRHFSFTAPSDMPPAIARNTAMVSERRAPLELVLALGSPQISTECSSQVRFSTGNFSPHRVTLQNQKLALCLLESDGQPPEINFKFHNTHPSGISAVSRPASAP